MEIKIELRHEDAKLPKKANPTDAAFDLYAVSRKNGYSYIEYDTGVAIQLPPNTVGLIFPRSSVSNYDLSLCNCVGVLDENYGGTVKLRFRITEDYPKIYEVGDRIGQIIFMPLPVGVILQLVDKIYGNRGGLGSTGA